MKEKNRKQIQNSLTELLLSHHPPQHLHRTLKLNIYGREIFLCARCSGILSGIILYASLNKVFPLFFLQMGNCTKLIIIIMGMLPALIDFYIQIIHLRESTNLRRIITGGLFGISCCQAILSLVSGRLLNFGSFIAILFIYWIGVFSSQKRVQRVIEHLALYLDYFHICQISRYRRAR